MSLLLLLSSSENIYEYTMAGGAVAGGAATTEFYSSVHEYTMAGGAVSGGAATTVFDPALDVSYTMSGGSVSGGAAITALNTGRRYTDNFNRADGAPGSPWVNWGLFSQFGIVGNEIVAGLNALVCAMLYNQPLDGDQFSQLRSTGGMADGDRIYLVVRGSIDGAGYMAIFMSSGTFVYRALSSVSFVFLASDSTPVNDLDACRFDAVGTTLRARVNGEIRVETTDSTYSSGLTGAGVYRAN